MAEFAKQAADQIEVYLPNQGSVGIMVAEPLRVINEVSARIKGLNGLLIGGMSSTVPVAIS